MCIIAIKQHDARAENWRGYMRNMAAANDDGGGLITIHNNPNGVPCRVKWEKTIHPDVEDWTRRMMNPGRHVVHFRIATHGGISPQMCHPFLVSANRGNLLNGTLRPGELLLVHNGVLLGLGCAAQSDTADLSERLRPFAAAMAGNMAAAARLLATIAGSSRLAVVNAEGEIAMAGPWPEDHDKHSFSNTSYAVSVRRGIYVGCDNDETEEETEEDKNNEWTRIFGRTYYPQNSRG